MSYVETYGFGSGVLWGTPGGSGVVTPVRFGVLQDVSVDFTFSIKELFGTFQFPLALGRGTAKITGKATTGAIDKGVFAGLFFNDTPAANQVLVAESEAGTVPGSSAYTITVANHSQWSEDLGVVYAATGEPLTRVSPSSEALGKYSVAAGVYTFASADAAAAVLIAYRYTGSGGFKTVIANNLLGDAPTFGIDLYQRSQKDQSQQWSMRLYSCVSTKLTLATKLEDFILPAFEFAAFANAANNIGEINTPH